MRYAVCSETSRVGPVRSGPNGCSRRRHQRKRLADDQAVANSKAAPARFSGGNLEHGFRAAATGDAPGLEVGCDLDDAQVAVEEHGIDREAHERHVHRGSWPQEYPLAVREVSTAEQPLHARERHVPEDTALTHDASVFATNRDFG